MASHSSPFDKVVSSSSGRISQTTPRNSSHRAATLPPEGQGESVGLNESEKARPYDRSQAAIQDQLLEQQGEQSSERVRQKPSRRSTAPLDPPSSTPADSQPFDLSKLQQGQIHNQASGYLGGAGQSSTNLLSIPDDKSSSQRQLPGVAGKEPSASGSAAQVVSERELHERPKKEKEDGELEKLEGEEKREELERGEEGRKARERRGEVEREKRGDGFEHRKKEEAEEAAKKAKGVPEPTERATAVPVQTMVIPPPSPAIQGPSPNENVPPVAGSSGRIIVDKSLPLQTISPTKVSQGAGRPNPDKNIVGDGYHQGGPSRNPSRTHLLNNPSLDHLGEYNQSRTNMLDGEGTGSRLDLPNTGDATLSRRTSSRDASGINGGHTARKTSHRDLQIGSKSRNQSRTDVGGTLPEDREPSPQGNQDQQEPPHELKKHTGASNLQTNGGPPGNREQDAENVLESVSDQPKTPAWKILISDTLSRDERVSLIATIFADKNETEMVRNLSGDDAQAFVDTVDKMISTRSQHGSPTLDRFTPQIRRKCLHTLHSVCGRQALLPRSLEIPLCHDPAENPLCHGGFADVWKGRHQGREVAAKVLKVYKNNNLEKIRKRFCREVVGWNTLFHPNILPLLGATMSDNRFMMVSEWMTKGNINEFVEANPNADRLGLLVDATQGLIYMHEEGLVHGDLKGANILIGHDGHACLADFSLLTIASDQSTVISSCIQGGTIQWMSPELLDPGRFGLTESRPTKESDCYALGMVIYEVLSGQTPFAPSKSSSVIWKVLEGQRPERPQGKGGALFADDLWRILELCWKYKPEERTNAKVVLRCLERASLPPRPSSKTDGTGTRPDASGSGTSKPGDTPPGEKEEDTNSGCCNCVIM